MARTYRRQPYWQSRGLELDRNNLFEMGRERASIERDCAAKSKKEIGSVCVFENETKEREREREREREKKIQTVTKVNLENVDSISHNVDLAAFFPLAPSRGQKLAF